jgi:hypothetical protein
MASQEAAETINTVLEEFIQESEPQHTLYTLEPRGLNISAVRKNKFFRKEVFLRCPQTSAGHGHFC